MAAQTVQLNQIDTAAARLTQASGVLAILSAAGADNEGFDKLTHTSVMDSLYALEELLDQARTAVRSIKPATA